jgi:hypothetical protein
VTDLGVLRAQVFARDNYTCIPARLALDEGVPHQVVGPCRYNAASTAYPPGQPLPVAILTLETVRDQAAMGAPHIEYAEDHTVACCMHHHTGSLLATSHNAKERSRRYLDVLYPSRVAHPDCG